MRAVDEDALICDFQEYYHIPDYGALEVEQAAVLAAGLPQSSRIKQIMTGSRCTREEIILGVIADGINTLVWFQTEDGHKNQNRPKSIVNKLLGKEEKQEKEVETFSSSEEFERTRARLLAEG